MARTDEEIVGILLELYAENFGGKEGQRFLISWGDMRSLYGFYKLFYSRFYRLEEAAIKNDCTCGTLVKATMGILLLLSRRGLLTGGDMFRNGSSNV